MKFALSALAGALLVAMPVAAEEFSAAEKAAIDQQIRAYILENPEVIIDYIEVVDPRSLTPTETITESTRVILAVKVGKTRLIDNADLSTNDGLSHHL